MLLYAGQMEEEGVDIFKVSAHTPYGTVRIEGA